MFVGHQHLLQRETIGAIAPLLERFDLGEAPGRVGMIEVIPGAVAAPAGRQLHRHHVDLFVGERWQGVGFGLPRRQRAVQPLGVVTAREVLTEMSAAAFGALERAIRDAQRQLEHLLHPIGRHQFRIGAARLVAQADVATAQ